MHEMGIAQEIVGIVQASIPAHLHGTRVERVRLRIGTLSAVVADSLRFCFEALTRDTPLAGAELAIAAIPVTARCLACDHRWTIETPAFACPRCSGGDIRILSGRELEIEAIELADEAAAGDAGGQGCGSR
jgi:hydrogenase nickel incorporation protein HypA/HybF